MDAWMCGCVDVWMCFRRANVRRAEWAGGGRPGVWRENRLSEEELMLDGRAGDCGRAWMCGARSWYASSRHTVLPQCTATQSCRSVPPHSPAAVYRLLADVPCGHVHACGFVHVWWAHTCDER
eukprot:365904-Chlamydomonas_euryale.AAC.9